MVKKLPTNDSTIPLMLSSCVKKEASLFISFVDSLPNLSQYGCLYRIGFFLVKSSGSHVVCCLRFSQHIAKTKVESVVVILQGFLMATFFSCHSTITLLCCFSCPRLAFCGCGSTFNGTLFPTSHHHVMWQPLKCSSDCFVSNILVGAPKDGLHLKWKRMFFYVIFW